MGVGEVRGSIAEIAAAAASFKEILGEEYEHALLVEKKARDVGAAVSEVASAAHDLVYAYVEPTDGQPGSFRWTMTLGEHVWTGERKLEADWAIASRRRLVLGIIAESYVDTEQVRRERLAKAAKP